MAKKGLLVLVLAALVAGGTFAQVVVGAGVDASGTTTVTGPTETSSSSFTLDLNGGYRMELEFGLVGFGLDASFGGSETKPLSFSGGKSTTLKLGGYFEYALLNTEKFAFWGKINLGYIGQYDLVREDNMMGDETGFYVNIAPVLEYKMFANVAIFASIPLITFTTTTFEHKKVFILGSGWVDRAVGAPLYKVTETEFSFPIIQPLAFITIGVKFVF